MQLRSKPAIVAIVSTVVFAFGATPAVAAPLATNAVTNAVAEIDAPAAQTLSATHTLDTADLDALSSLGNPANAPHGFDVAATIATAQSEIGTSRATGWSQPGECIMSAQRWITAGGGDWQGGGDPVSNYQNATRLTLANAQPGDIIQYEHLEYPTAWVTGVHTVLITEVHDDGTFTIIESNNPGGSGLVSENTSWTPEPPEGFQAVVWRF